MPSKYLQIEDNVIRYVPWSRIRTDEDGNVQGILGDAFVLRAEEEYLSVTWCEYFQGSLPERIRCAAEAIRNSELTVGSKGRFAVACVKDVDDFLKIANRTVRFIHEAEADNPAHVAIRRWPVDDLELLERLAEDIWNVSYSKNDVDAMPLSTCAISARGAELP